MWRRLVSVILCAVSFGAVSAPAADESGISLTGLKAAALIEPTTGEKIFSVGDDTENPVAGLCKLPAIITLTQAFDEGAIEKDAKVRISRYAASIPGPTAFLNADNTCSASELIKAAVMISAGDAIMALGEHIFGSEDIFLDNIHAALRLSGVEIELMGALGEGCTFSAGTLAALGSAAIQSETFLQYAACYMDTITHQDGRVTELVNANRLIRSYAGCSGLLTGSSPTDGYSGVFYALRGGLPLIAVVVGAENAADRFAAAEKMLDHGFANFRLFNPAEAGAVMAADVPVRGGEQKSISLISQEKTAILLKKNAAEPLEERLIPEFLPAPIAAETEAGQIRYKDSNGAVLAEVRLFPEKDVASFGILDILRKIAESFIGRA